MARRVRLAAGALIAMWTLTFATQAQAQRVAPPHASLAVASTGAWWGIDTVDNVETGNIIAQTTADLGKPQFVGRYLVYSSERGEQNDRDQLRLWILLKFPTCLEPIDSWHPNV